jgi:hypothetical protein
MGNCCDARTILSDNDAENLIRESILLLRIRKFDLEEVEEIFTAEIGLSLIEIKNNITKWITKEKYEKLVSDDLVNSNCKISHHLIHFNNIVQNQRCVTLNYNEQAEGKGFHISLALWLIPLIKNTPQSRIEKVKFIEQIILKSDEILTFSTFNKFLSRYLEICLIKITHNFYESEDIQNDYDLKKQYQKLINQVYTKENVDNYKKKLMENVSLNIVLRNSMLKNKDISNEFIKRSHIKLFFDENPFLLDIIELRENFYDIYTKKIISYINE